ncbi:CdaR family protein [Gorillibacterium timonense]|uniref:CdaR family protein n=1 Tax=Gorillibacterium timonense TaxID=1689269 RepID=UPI00071E2535|nr:CdaR family protein [Gorillibacterium timonense]
MDKFLQNNNVVKAVAVLIAILLWLVVRLDSNDHTTRTVNSERRETISNVVVNPVYDESSYAIKSISPQEVTVELRWSDSNFRKPNFSELRVEANLSNLTEGTHQVFLSTSGIKTNVEASISPPTVQVTLEKIQHKQLSVSIIPTGKPFDGYKAGQPIVKPSRVSVSVPESLLNVVSEVRAEVSVEGAKDTVVKQVKLTMYDKDGKVVDGEISPAVVDVEIPITSPFKQMPMQLKLKGEPASGYAVEEVTQEPETVTVYAPQDVLNKMEFYEGLELDLSGLTATRKSTLTIPLQEGVTKVIPEEIEATVKIVPAVTKTLSGIPVAMTGQSRDYTYTLSSATSSINLTLEGAQSVLDRLQPQDIPATVDLSSLGPGIHELPVIVNLPLYVKKQGADPMVQIEITAKTGESATPSTSSPTPSGSETPSPSPSPVATPAMASPSVSPREEEAQESSTP